MLYHRRASKLAQSTTSAWWYYAALDCTDWRSLDKCPWWPSCRGPPCRLLWTAASEQPSRTERNPGTRCPICRRKVGLSKLQDYIVKEIIKRDIVWNLYVYFWFYRVTWRNKGFRFGCIIILFWLFWKHSFINIITMSPSFTLPSLCRNTLALYLLL